MKVLVTGSSGLIGSEMALHFDRRGARVVGLDNNGRADFFGPEGDTRWNLERLRVECRRFLHRSLDIRDRPGLEQLFRADGPFDLVVHCAAQPSHDLSARRPLDDFDVNAGGTINLLEQVRQRSPEAVFVLLSTNKVYGDAPNELPLVELETRFDYALPEHAHGVSESMRIDASKHSLFGASKLAADIMTQEYGRYFGLLTHCLRGGCLTGPNHSAVELHGFLSYLVKCQLEGRPYRVYGHKGKQVRDNIHSDDVASLIDHIVAAPRPAGVYNLGGGRENSCSIREAFARVQELSGRAMDHAYDERARAGDHVCYVSDLRKLKEHFPGWRITHSLDDILRELVAGWRVRLGSAQAACG